jgi:AcrR family transcriptional regulator
MGLTANEVVSAGTTLASRAGVQAIGVRAVAAELGVTPMALYRHVGDADALHAAVVAALLEDLPVARLRVDWQHDVRAWARAARRVFVSAPGLAHHVLLNWLDLPAALRAVDSLGTLFAEHGPPRVDAVAASNAVFTFVLMRSAAEEAVRGAGVHRSLVEMRRHRRDVPFLWEHRAEYAEARLDRHFEYGLAAILRGVA